MSWPTIDDYRGALQSPSRVFRDARLQSCSAELNRMMVPRGRAGGNAIVYRLNNSSWSAAVRVFINPPKPGRQARYQIVHAYLQQARPRCLVEFGYDPEGILINGGRFPIQTLEWVEGETLGEWLKGAVERGDSRAIKQTADAWIELVGELRTHKIAHGDLQHGNVMVLNDRLVLVDYDCMFVPSMKTEKDREAWEDGLPGYQHPKRPGQLLSPELDNFSAWVILIALRAVADDPSLWHTYIGGPGIENLLFTKEDIKDPARSKLWPDLMHNAKDRMVREWTERLRKSLDESFEKIPTFDIDIFGPLREVIAAGDWRQIHELATGSKYASKTFPANLAPKVQEAIKRVECHNQLEHKIRTGGVREIAAAYRPELLDDWADPDLIAKAQTAKGAVKLLGELARAEQSDPAGRLLVALWDGHGRELQGLTEADEYRVKVEAWKQRITAADLLDQAVQHNEPEQRIAGAWKVVTDLGGHRDAERHRGRAELALHRLKALGDLKGLPRSEDEKSDQALIKVWKAVAQTLDGCTEADKYRSRATAARQRLIKFAELKRKIDDADHGRGGEHEVVAAAATLPAGYGAGLQERVNKAKQRIAASQALEEALRAMPQSDLAIAAAAERARGDGTWPTDVSRAARCELALSRSDRIRALDAISKSLPLDEQDAQWIAMWDDDLLGDCHDARDHRRRYEQARARVAAYGELERAISNEDVVTVKRLSRDPRLACHPALEKRKAEIDTLIATCELIARLLESLRNGQAEAFLAEADPNLLATHAKVFIPYKEQITAWFEHRLRQQDVLRLTDPQFLSGGTASTVIARWVWAQPRLVSNCMVATDPLRFLERPEEARNGTQKLNPDIHRLGGGASFSVPQGYRKMYVTVWPVVELGWVQLIGPPLHVGPYIAKSRGLARGQPAGGDGRRPWSERFQRWLVAILNS
ncbi:MAG TPA: hypothetical protein VJY33_03960 [Isosphaeraceae bacterium]|nr:hypothetical protein [Isosphaeraceae bacterium]